MNLKPGKFHSKRSAFIYLFIIVLTIACKRDNIRQEFPIGSNQNINTWILDSLKRYYYWNEKLPAKPDLNAVPEEFFTAVKNAADRFSYVVLPGVSTSIMPGSKSKYGFDYSTIKELSTGKVVGVIKMVLNDSPASRNGLKRGDYIRSINGSELTEANAVTLQAELLSGSKVSLEMVKIVNNSFSDIRSVEIQSGVTFEQPSISKVIETGSTKVGYLYFNDFNPGLASSLGSKFAAFKSSGIADLILDLRYNSGGQVAEAAGLCAMIAQGVTYNTPFITYKGNKNGGVRNESLGSAATFDGTANFNTLLQNNLGLRRIYILGTAATASAAEVVINNLKPYMQVILVGEKTRGKDEASFMINDQRNPKQVQWEMHPIIYKLFNASGNGSYSSGIDPDMVVNELASLPLMPFGEIGDPLINAAITLITGRSKITTSSLKPTNVNIPNAGIILADTHISSTQNTITITHR